MIFRPTGTFIKATYGTFVQNVHNSSRTACPLRPGFRDLCLALGIAIFSRSTTHGYFLEDLTSELFNLGNNGPKFLPPAIAPTFFHPPNIWIRPPARRAYASERLSLIPLAFLVFLLVNKPARLCPVQLALPARNALGCEVAVFGRRMTSQWQAGLTISGNGQPTNVGFSCF